VLEKSRWSYYNDGMDSDDLAIKPTSDLFAAVLWSPPKNEPILRSLLNGVLTDFGQPPIVKATVLNPFNIKEFAVDKSLVLDVRVEDERNQLYDIEVQTGWHTGFENRTLQYWADTYSSQLRIGDPYVKLCSVKSIIITEFPVFSSLKRLHTIFEIRARENPDVLLTDHFQMHFLRLGDMLKNNMEGMNELGSDLRSWMIFFAFGATTPEDKMQTLLENNRAVCDAYLEYQRFTSNPEMREKARQRQRFLQDYKIGIDAAKDEGKIEGKIETAVKMKSKGFKLSDIADITGLTVSEIERL
jgi:predicted transposase/invertase (TIGR01784 family)